MSANRTSVRLEEHKLPETLDQQTAQLESEGYAFFKNLYREMMSLCISDEKENFKHAQNIYAILKRNSGKHDGKSQKPYSQSELAAIFFMTKYKIEYLYQKEYFSSTRFQQQNTKIKWLLPTNKQLQAVSYSSKKNKKIKNQIKQKPTPLLLLTYSWHLLLSAIRKNFDSKNRIHDAISAIVVAYLLSEDGTELQNDIKEYYSEFKKLINSYLGYSNKNNEFKLRFFNYDLSNNKILFLPGDHFNQFLQKRINNDVYIRFIKAIYEIKIGKATTTYQPAQISAPTTTSSVGMFSNNKNQKRRIPTKEGMQNEIDAMKQLIDDMQEKQKQEEKRIEVLEDLIPMIDKTRTENSTANKPH